MRTTKRIYVASSWRNQFQPMVVDILKREGFEVYDFKKDGGFAWDRVDPDWEKWTFEDYVTALNHPTAQAGFKSDMDAMKWADTFVLVLPCGRSAHLELGWACNSSRRTAVYSPIDMEPELMVKMADFVVNHIPTLLDWLHEEVI